MPTYSYPVPNSTLIKDLKLEEHPEGGFFVQTSILPEQVSSPYAGKSELSISLTFCTAREICLPVYLWRSLSNRRFS